MSSSRGLLWFPGGGDLSASAQAQRSISQYLKKIRMFQVFLVTGQAFGAGGSSGFSRSWRWDLGKKNQAIYRILLVFSFKNRTEGFDLWLHGELTASE